MDNVNVNTKTGFRFGVVSVMELKSEIVHEELMPVYPCDECDVPEGERPDKCDGCEPVKHSYSSGGISYMLDRYNDVWVLDSPYVTKCKLCSLCAPNAGYIQDQDDEGYLTHILPLEYFRNPENYNFIRIEDLKQEGGDTQQ